MDNCKPENIEVVEDLAIQSETCCDRDRVGGRFEDRRSARPPVKPPCVNDRVLGTGGDSSLLFFFLLLVVIVCQSDCDIEMDTLLWFFLLLVVLYNNRIF